MLVLTRKANQQIQIGDNVVLTILQVKGNTVRVGIEAPRDVRVIRGELRGLDADRTTQQVEKVAAEETVVSTRAANPTSMLKVELRHDLRSLPLQPGLAVAAGLEFSPIRSTRRLGSGALGNYLPRR